MYLVIGATGILGSSICNRLSESGRSVRGLIRPTARAEIISRLRDAGVELALGDLKDPESLRRACTGATAVISTASSTLSRQEGDSIATVDLAGQVSLIKAAKDAGVQHFTFVSIPRSPVRESPLTRAKFQVENELAASGIPYTILAASYFMEVWLSPALGFDYANSRAVVFGDGRQLMSWVSCEDVGAFATGCAETPEAHNRVLEIGGPDDLSPLQVIRIFEEVQGRSWHVDHVMEDALLAQLKDASDALSESFCKLQLEYLHGSLADTAEALRLMPVRQKTVREYAAEVTGPTAVRPGNPALS